MSSLALLGWWDHDGRRDGAPRPGRWRAGSPRTPPSRRARWTSSATPSRRSLADPHRIWSPSSAPTRHWGRSSPADPRSAGRARECTRLRRDRVNRSRNNLVRSGAVTCSPLAGVGAIRSSLARHVPHILRRQSSEADRRFDGREPPAVGSTYLAIPPLDSGSFETRPAGSLTHRLAWIVAVHPATIHQ